MNRIRKTLDPMDTKKVYEYEEVFVLFYAFGKIIHAVLIKQMIGRLHFFYYPDERGVCLNGRRCYTWEELTYGLQIAEINGDSSSSDTKKIRKEKYIEEEEKYVFKIGSSNIEMWKTRIK